MISENILYSPWFLHELRIYINNIEKWKNNENWTNIKKSLKDKNHFRHTMMKLLIADHFEKQNIMVKLVPREEAASPDLMIKNKEVKEWLYLECYQPYLLSGRDKKISNKEVKMIVKRIMDKAKKQFKRHYPGVIFLCSYYLTNRDLEIIKNEILDRLNKTKRRYFGGVLLLNFYVEIFRAEKLMISPKYHIDFIKNPYYFSKIQIETPEVIPKNKIHVKLPLINKNNIKNRTIIKSGNNITPPYFDGRSNNILQCGKCESILAENVWDLSLNNLILFCSECGSYNEIKKYNHKQYTDSITRIAVVENEFITNQCINLRVGVMIIGIKKEEETMRFLPR